MEFLFAGTKKSDRCREVAVSGDFVLVPPIVRNIIAV